MLRNDQLSRKTVYAISCIVILLNVLLSRSNNLESDVFGYYLYLPLIFIYNDLGLENVNILYDIIDQYNSSGTFYQAVELPSGGWVLKYSSGMAILYLPFFFIGHLSALILDYPADGFSVPYQFFIILGGILYTICGLFLLRRFLLLHFKDNVVSMVLVLVYFGTNYIFYSSLHGAGSSPHNYLFTLYAAILWLTYRWHKTRSLKHIILLAIVCGLNILARPSEVVCLLIPLLWDISDRASFRKKIKLLVDQRGQVLIFFIVLVLIGSIQFIYWKIYTGSFLYYSYGGNAGEGFDLFHPHIREVLFSFRKGWVIYTPASIFIFIGFFYLHKYNRNIFYPILSFFLINLYIVSSWSCWWYAESFGPRSLVQSLAVMTLPIGAFYTHLFKKNSTGKTSIIVISIIIILLNIFQLWQYNKGVVHGSRMTMEYYFATFGKLKVNSADRKLLLVERATGTVEELKNDELYDNSTLDFLDMESVTIEGVSSTESYSSSHSFGLDKDHIYSPSIEARFSNITDHHYAWLRISAMVFPTTDISDNPVSLVVSFRHDGSDYKYRTLDLEGLDLTVNEWNKITFDYMTPEVRTKNDKLKTYIWLRGKDLVYVDDLKVEVFEPNTK